MRVLIVDDSSVSREHLNFIVRNAGYEPMMFESAVAVLHWSEQHGLEETLILLDWIMPEIQGPELCAMIREKSPKANCYIIIASAKNESADIAEGLGSGADDYVSKPFSPQEVTARLEVGVRTIKLRSELQEANRRRLAAERFAGVGQLAAGAAHEINNPLGFLKSNLSLLQTQLPDLLGYLKALTRPATESDEKISARMIEELTEMLDDSADMLLDMRSGVDRIGAIVGSLRAFTSDTPNLTANVDLSALVTEVCGAGVQLDLQLNQNITGDRAQLKSYLYEVLDNARWATRQGGEISLSLSAAQGKCRLVISDTGCGIEAKNLTKVTDPFFSTRPVGEALGMGLTRAQAVVRNHGGEMQVWSTKGNGTQVVCEMPLA